MTSTYPEFLLRGIPTKDFICAGTVLPDAFQFGDFGRDDNKKELSINWLDDDGAIQNLLSQEKPNGKLQFPAGAAKIKLNQIKMIFSNIQQGNFSYERAALPNNKYHGNLLLDSAVDKRIKLLVMNGLALAAGTNIITQEKFDKK